MQSQPSQSLLKSGSSAGVPPEAASDPVSGGGTKISGSRFIDAIQRAVAEERQLAPLLQRFITICETTLAARWVHIWVLDPQSNLLELQACSQENIAETPLFPRQIPLGISIIGLTLENRTPYISNDIRHSIFGIPSHLIDQAKLASFAAYPLLAGGDLVGVLALGSQQEFSRDVQKFLAWMMPVMGCAVAYHRSQTALHSRQETVLYRLAGQIQNSLDLDTILAVAIQEIRDIFQIDHCSFLWCWSNVGDSDAAAGGQPLPPIIAITHESKIEAVNSLLGECSADQVNALAPKILSLQGLCTTDVDQDAALESPVRDLLRGWGLKACLLHPLETQFGQLGAILCGQTEEPRLWTPSETALLQAIADQLSIAINQAELHAQTRASAFAAQTQARQLSEALEGLKQAQARLIQSEKMSSLGQLVAGIAHEINNPVNFISGNIDYARDYFKDLITLIELYQSHCADPHEDIQAFTEEIDLPFLLEDLQKLLQSMQVGSERIRQIVLSLRNFSRLDEAELKAVDIHEGIDNTLLILHNRLKAKGDTPEIEVVKHYGDLPAVQCFAGPLNQVFMNLLGNAIDALEDQPAPHRITITTSKSKLVQADGCLVPTVKIQVHDNGPGIAADHLDHLFEPFFTTKAVGKGTGLGLAISYQIIVERHRGLLTCTSELGAGSEFTIEIPVQQEAG